MEYDKINNLLGSQSENLSKFVTREYVRVNSLSNTYDENKSIRFKTPMLRSDLCDYADTYILVSGTILVEADHIGAGVDENRDRRNRPLILKNNAPFISCITKINYKKTVGSLYNYYRDELSDDDDNNNFDNIKVVNSNAFRYKNKITSNTYNLGAADAGYDANKNGKQDIELAIPLKYLGNFWRALNMLLISCEVFLELKWNKNCIITSLESIVINAGPPIIRSNVPTSATLSITECKLYIPVVTLSKDDAIKLLNNLKSGFKREIIWNKCRPQMSTEAINNNLNILIDPTFTNVNKLFVIAYQVDANNNDNRQSFSQFYLPRAMVKDYNVIIDKPVFFDLPIKNEEEAYEKITDIGKNNEYTTGNLLDYDYFKKYYKLIAID